MPRLEQVQSMLRLQQPERNLVDIPTTIKPAPEKTFAQKIREGLPQFIQDALFGRAEEFIATTGKIPETFQEQLATTGILRDNILLPFLTRSDAVSSQLLEERLKKDGSSEDRSFVIAKSLIQAKTSKEKEEIKKKLNLTSQENKSLTVRALATTAGIGLDILALPIASLKAVKPGIANLLKESKTVEQTSTILREARVPEDLIEIYSPVFAKETNAKKIEEGISSLEKTMKATPLKKAELPQLPEARALPSPDKLSRESLTLPKDTTVIEELQPLAQEARKYKSAEEFVKEQGTPLYHGTRQPLRKEKGLFSLTTDKSVAENYSQAVGGGRTGAKNIPELEGAYLYDDFWKFNKEKNVFEFNGKTKTRNEMQELANRFEASAKFKGARVDEYFIDPNVKVLDLTNKSGIDAILSLSTNGNKGAEKILSNTKANNAFDWGATKSPEQLKAFNEILLPQLEAKGFGGINYFDDIGKTTAVFDTKSLKTKSQLTDFYNQAVKGAEKVKERRFYQSIEKSPNTTPELKQAIKELPPEVKQYDVVTDKSSLARAQEFINTQGEDTALSSVLRAEEMSKDLSVMGQELMRRYQQTDRTNLAVDIAHHLATKATVGGQIVQSFSILNKLSPEGILLFASRRTGQKLSPQFSEKITAQAKKIEEMPYGYEKFKETQKMIETIAKETPKGITEKGYDWLLELFNMPRTMMSSFFDFSFGLRQGIVTLYSHPKEFGRAFKAQFKPFASEGAYDDLMDTVMKHPDFELAEKYGVGFTDINLKLGAREERYMSSFAEKIPILGIPIRATNRAYTAMANKLRIDTFSSEIKNAERIGMNAREDGKFLRDTAKIVNDFTGRGEFGSGRIGKALEAAKELLNAFFFSPRLAASRINLLYPGTYVKLNPQTRKEALRGMLAMASGTTTLLYLASLIPGVEVGVDPRSADFGKIKHGSTRIDIMGGFQQYIRMGSQFISGKYVSSSTGKVITLGEGYNPLTQTDILLKGVESKEAPIFSFAAALMRGQDFEGNKISALKEIGQRFVPMLASDVYELYKEDPELLPLGLVGMFGVGIQSYAPPEAYIKLNEINNSPDPAAAYDQLKVENPLLATKVKKAKKEENFTEFDWMLTSMKVNNGDRARFLIERFNSLKTKEEKAELYDDLRDKKIISDTVAEQIKNLLEAQQ